MSAVALGAHSVAEDVTHVINKSHDPLNDVSAAGHFPLFFLCFFFLCPVSFFSSAAPPVLLLNPSLCSYSFHRSVSPPVAISCYFSKAGV